MLLQLEPVASPRVQYMLQAMSDESKMWSSFGLRSLSRSDSKFGKEENYWRGAIWMNMNYLALKALKTTYGSIEGPYRTSAMSLYHKLRTALITNVVEQYNQTGFIWESYDGLTGEGRGCHPFSGWTSLIALIISEDYE